MIFNSTPTLKLFNLLSKIDVIVDFTQKKHSYNHFLSNQQSPPTPGQNWIALAVVSLSQEWIELIPVTRSTRDI